MDMSGMEWVTQDTKFETQLIIVFVSYTLYIYVSRCAFCTNRQVNLNTVHFGQCSTQSLQCDYVVPLLHVFFTHLHILCTYGFFLCFVNQYNCYVCNHLGGFQGTLNVFCCMYRFVLFILNFQVLFKILSAQRFHFAPVVSLVVAWKFFIIMCSTQISVEKILGYFMVISCER